jgi:hypothetical protein
MAGPEANRPPGASVELSLLGFIAGWVGTMGLICRDDIRACLGRWFLNY